MRFNQILYSFCLVVLGANSLSVELIKGYERSEIPRTIKKQMWNSDGGPFVADGLVQSNTENQYYWLFRSSSVSIYDTSSSRNLSAWPLTRWPYEPIESAVLERYEQVRRDFSTLHPSPTHPLGCLNSTPLRYGDIDEDGVNELVVFIGNQLLVFSPSAQKTVFGMNMRVDDWMTEEETQSHFEYYPPAGIDEITPYYQSAANMDYASELPGYRGYGKLYSSDFDKNGSPDILVWRKLYLSRMLNADKGFDKISDTFYHYETSATGEYVLKDTAPEAIQNWLDESNLTWQSGYPSNSECAGEEGQLIPEMHDPLLNDPDVLK
jgi:hypothetical protein